MKTIYIAGYNNLDYININNIENNIIRSGNISCSTIEECSDVLIPHDLRFHSSTAPDEERAKILGKNVIAEREL